MYDTGGRCRAELDELTTALAVKAAPWWDQVPLLFEPELAHPTLVQVRLDAGFVALVLRSHFQSLRRRCFQLLAERSLSFAVASASERMSKQRPEDAWLLKLAISGEAPHAKLYLDRRITLEELAELTPGLGLPERAVSRAAERLLEATGAPRLRCVSVSPGNPLRLELYASCPAEPGSPTEALETLGELARVSYDPSFEALVDAHAVLGRRGRQRYAIGIDGRGIRDGLKVSYADAPAMEAVDAVCGLAPAPLLAARRLRSAREALQGAAIDHFSVRVRSERPPHITAYFNRSWVGVA